MKSVKYSESEVKLDRNNLVKVKIGGLIDLKPAASMKSEEMEFDHLSKISDKGNPEQLGVILE